MVRAVDCGGANAQEAAVEEEMNTLLFEFAEIYGNGDSGVDARVDELLHRDEFDPACTDAFGNNLVIRPELRYDWFSQDLGNAAQGVGLPFGKTAGGLGTQSDQFYGGCDIIWQF